ncbi:ATP-binding protein [Candidatus Amarolinea aalborgensis]|uniref:ATP-binding protein n=1 Tax=Candidatus Amarolinea aalborgensis TaxID=2249329 RepID=UPI003BF99A9D
MAEHTELRKGTETFRPRARLVSVLGEQLIRDATVGLLELVKNGYDADANQVSVSLLNLADSEQTIILVEDDGVGMDLETVLSRWLEPATGHKEEAKKRAERTPRGRLPLGEKGVGRFAAHKLGHELTLISRARDANGQPTDVEIVVNVAWDDFEKPDAYLSEIGVNYEERLPLHFTHSSGTLLEIKRARSSWKRKDIEKVSRALRRLMSPFRPPGSFSVTLHCPEYPQYENLDASELLKTAHAQMLVLVDQHGIAQYEYQFNLPPYPSRIVEPQEKDLRLGIEGWNPSERISHCGSFFVTLYVWDRSTDSLNLSGTSRGDLDQMNGIAVFRDGIRVMPYGEPDDDWLEIDKSRYMTSTGAFSRKNVVGAVEINQSENGKLRDKSNREGFIEDEAFADFYDLLKGVLREAFNLFGDDRKKIREGEKAKKRELIPAIDQLNNSIAQATDAIQKTKQMAHTLATKGKISQEVAEQLTVNLQQEQIAMAVALTETKQAATDIVQRFDEEREMLLALAGLGLAAERFTHEFARMTREASDLLREIERHSVIQQVSYLKDRVEALGVTLEALRDLVLALGPMFYIRRKTVEKPLDVKTIVEHALLLNQGQIKENRILVEVRESEGQLTVTMRRGALTQVFNNLIDNACYWLSRKSEEGDRRLRIVISAAQRYVLLADNGPGIHPRDQHRIFQVFFSTKIDGRGLGLFIAREILAEARSTVVLLDPSEHPDAFRVGAAFKVQFPEQDIEENGRP